MDENKIASQATEIPAIRDDDYIKIKGIDKNYGVVHALKEVTFGIKKGEIRTFLGENGAGKSTLIKCIMGEETPDSGSIIVDGKEMTSYSIENSQSMGISMVHQELAIFENMTVAENIFPNSVFCKGKKGIVVDTETLNQKAKESLELFDLDLEPTQTMDSLTLAQQQMVEILRCICNNQKIILLDEPTSGLNNEEADRLMKITRGLAASGITIIYISHRINEVMEISDNITVMRDGSYICTYVNDGKLTEDDLVSRMVGHNLSAGLYSKKKFYDASKNEVILKVDNLAKEGALEPISFELHKGEIIGFFGLEGSGSNTLSRMMYGLEGKDSGTMELFGKEVKINPTVLIKEKMLYLNNNRKKAGLLLNSGANDNMLVPVINDLSKGGLVDATKSYDLTEKFVKLFSIAIPSVFQKPKNLSGGNQQKLMLSMCLGKEPNLMVVNEPTRGIDVGAKSDIHRFLNQCSEEGIGLVVFSSEMPELISLCDRIYVLQNKKMSGVLSGDEITEEAVVKLAAGSN